MGRSGQHWPTKTHCPEQVASHCSRTSYLEFESPYPWAQPGQFADAQPSIGADQDQGAVARGDGVGQGGDLGRGQEPHLLPVYLGQRHPPARRLRDHAGVHGRAHDRAEELVSLLDRAGASPRGAHSATQAEQPLCRAPGDG